MYGIHGHGRCYTKGTAYIFPGYGYFPPTPADEAEALKFYKERLELHKKEIEAELIRVEKRLRDLEAK